MEVKSKIGAADLRKKVTKFTKSDGYYLHRLSDNWTLYLTEGCFFVREMANAYWLYDLILSYQSSSLLFGCTLQTWKVKRYKSNMLQVTCKTSLSEEMIIQVMKNKSFPLEELTIQVEGDIARLPTEG